MDAWRTAIVTSDETGLWIRGYEIADLMRRSFTETIFLLHQGRLPSEGERQLIDAILVGGADHGPGAPSCAAARLAASGNRQSLAAPVAAGVLAIGETHGGAGGACVEMIRSGLARAEREGITLQEAAGRIVSESIGSKQRLPGFGHRVHRTLDPRAPVLFEMAKQWGIAGNGVEFTLALQAAIGERIKPMSINIDGATAAVLVDMGLSAEFADFLFIVSRVAGLTAEVAEERERERPMRIKIPVEYDGPPPREIS